MGSPYLTEKKGDSKKNTEGRKRNLEPPHAAVVKKVVRKRLEEKELSASTRWARSGWLFSSDSQFER